MIAQLYRRLHNTIEDMQNCCLVVYTTTTTREQLCISYLTPDEIIAQVWPNGAQNAC